jgi:putative membrane protein
MLRAILIIPVLLVLVLFALSNTQSVRLGFWPTDLTVYAPLSLAVLSMAALCFLFGAAIAWMAGLRYRSRARRAERSVAALEAEIASLRAPVAGTGAGILRPLGTALPPPS